MADVNGPPKRWVILKFWEGAVERAEHEIEELKAQGLFVRDATSQDKDRHGNPITVQPAQKPASAPVIAPPAA